MIREAVCVIQTGGIIVFPTRSLYGLGADANNPAAIRRLFQIKRRDPEKPVSVLIKSRKALASFVEDIPLCAVPLMDRFWPGRITLIFHAIAAAFPMLTAGTGKIGIRIPEHPVAVSLVSALLHPLTATSANYSGSPGVSRIKDLPWDFLNQVDMILDAGPLSGGTGSTIVDVTTDPPTVLREGAVSKKELIF
jgi:L-threonylcarbamoyladenylate synthase